jgi:hypothetical protein
MIRLFFSLVLFSLLLNACGPDTRTEAEKQRAHEARMQSNELRHEQELARIEADKVKEKARIKAASKIEKNQPTSTVNNTNPALVQNVLQAEAQQNENGSKRFTSSLSNRLQAKQQETGNKLTPSPINPFRVAEPTTGNAKEDAKIKLEKAIAEVERLKSEMSKLKIRLKQAKSDHKKSKMGVLKASTETKQAAIDQVNVTEMEVKKAKKHVQLMKKQLKVMKKQAKKAQNELNKLNSTHH